MFIKTFVNYPCNYNMTDFNDVLLYSYVSMTLDFVCRAYLRLQSWVRDDGAGNISVSIPLLEEKNKRMADYKEFVDLLPQLLQCIGVKVKEYPGLKTLPLTPSDIDTLTDAYDKVMKLPY